MMDDLDKVWSNFGLRRLQTDKVLPVSIFGGPVVRRNKGRVYVLDCVNGLNMICYRYAWMYSNSMMDQTGRLLINLVW